MKKLLESKTFTLLLYILITIIVGIVLYPIFDYVFALFTKSEFVYSIHDHLIRPMEMGLVMGACLYGVQYGKRKK